MLSDEEIQALRDVAEMYRSEFGRDARFDEAIQAIEKIERLAPWLRAMEQLELRAAKIEVQS
jgi:hypothetical protein